MDCNGCGSCCTDQTVPLNMLERKTTPPEEVDSNGNLRKINGHCVRLDPVTRRCTQYDSRPQICRDFKAGCGRCVIMRAFAEVNLGGIGEQPMRIPVRPGSFAAFVLHLQVDEDLAGNVTKITHPNPSYPVERALELANRELPSDGF